MSLSLEQGQMVTRSPTARHYNLLRTLVPVYGVCLRLVDSGELGDWTEDCKWHVLWSSEGGSWEEIVREKDLVACNEDADQI